jgi:hypothetical protein
MFELVAALLLFVPITVALVAVNRLEEDDDEEAPRVEAWMSDVGMAWVVVEERG